MTKEQADRSESESEWLRNVASPIEREAYSLRESARKLHDWAYDDTTSAEAALILRAAGAASKAAHLIEQACLTILAKRRT